MSAKPACKYFVGVRVEFMTWNHEKEQNSEEDDRLSLISKAISVHRKFYGPHVDQGEMKNF